MKKFWLALAGLLVITSVVVAAEAVVVLLKPKLTVAGQVRYELDSSGQTAWYLTSMEMQFADGYESPTNWFSVLHVHAHTATTSILVLVEHNSISNLVFDCEGLWGKHMFRYDDSLIVQNSDTNVALITPDARYE